MVAWTDNENWAVSLQRDYCGYVSDAFTPCQHRLPCPVHGSAAHRSERPAYLPPEDSPGGAPAPRMLEPYE